MNSSYDQHPGRTIIRHFLRRHTKPRECLKCAGRFVGVLMTPAIIGGTLWCFVFLTQSRIVFIDVWPGYLLGAWQFIVYPHHMVFEMGEDWGVAFFMHPELAAIVQWLVVVIPFTLAAHRLPPKWQYAASAGMVLAVGTLVLTIIYFSPYDLLIDTYTRQIFHIQNYTGIEL